VRPFTASTLAVCVLSALLELTVVSAAAAPTGCGDIHLYWHRGDRATGHSENSRSALRLAVRKGYGLETDLRTTKNGRIILMHDSTVNRTTSGKGKVSRLTSAQIRRHRLGDGSKVPYLAAALQVLYSHDGSTGMLELKRDAMPMASLRKLHSHLLDHGLRHRVVVYSNDRAQLRRFQSLGGRIATSLIANSARRDWTADDFERYGGATIQTDHVSAGLSRRALKIGLPVSVWGARTVSEWRTNVNAGTSALILNRPDHYDKWCTR
jgi:glycerophosphoryl diester phosphodiesterase